MNPTERSSRSRILIVAAVEEERAAWQQRLDREPGVAVEEFRSLAEALSSLPVLFDAAIVELPSAHPVVLPWLGRLHARQPGALIMVRMPAPDAGTEERFRAAGCSAVFPREESRERAVVFLRAALSAGIGAEPA